ncbi:MAG: AI-2E family transporter [Betaproteobacteria bacterium]|nr:MAG: AI-2E family transporter [Betaproteobacteria bacterium]
MDHKHPRDLHNLWWLALASIIGVLIYLLSSILAPFLLAGIIAYIFNPLVTRMAIWKISRTLGTILVMTLLLSVFTVFILIMVPLFEREVSRLIEKVPAYLETVRNSLGPWLETQFGISLQLDITLLKQTLTQNWQSAGGIVAKLVTLSASGGAAAMGFLLNLVLVPVVLFFLLRDWTQLVGFVDEIIPRHWYKQVNVLAREIDRVLAEFLRGQLSVMLLMSIYYVMGLWLVGLEFALEIGVIAGVLVFVPYLGMVIAFILASFVALMQFQEWSDLIPMWIVLGVGQLLENMVVVPWLVGNRIGLHPVVVIFALLAFAQLFGFVGLLLALPASAVLLVWLRHVRKQYLESTLYNL